VQSTGVLALINTVEQIERHDPAEAVFENKDHALGGPVGFHRLLIRR